MKKLALFIVNCSLLIASAAYAADGNLTSFSGTSGAANNNQYNQMMNSGRTPVAGGAAPNFGNCEALIQRCASPKCGNGGCADMNLAYPIVMGCVQSSAECQKHGDALASSIAAQLVASNTAKANSAAQAQAAQMAAMQQAQSNQQMEQMSAAMQQMQMQMAQQQAETAERMQQALAQAAEGQQQLLAQQQQLAAQQAAAAQTNTAEIGGGPVVQSMAESGISADLIARQQIAGQVMTALDGVNSSLSAVKKAVQDVIEYANCDFNASSCEGPKRVAAFKRKALNFFEPYENVLDKVEDSLDTAIAAGIDITDIYMMLNNMCSQWAMFLCPTRATVPIYFCKRTKPNGDATNITSYEEAEKIGNAAFCATSPIDSSYSQQFRNNTCTQTSIFRNDQRIEVQQSFIQAQESGSNTKLACISSGNIQMGRLGGRSRRNKGAGMDYDALQMIIQHDAPGSLTNDRKNFDYHDYAKNFCGVDAASGGSIEPDILVSALTQKTYKDALIRDSGNSTKYPIQDNSVDFIAVNERTCNLDENDNCWANPKYALCSVHAYNAALDTNYTDGENKEKMETIIALKSTIIAQQLKHQYDYLSATVKQMKVQLQKAVMVTNAEASGAASGSSGLGASGQINCGGSRVDVISCVSANVSRLKSMNSSDFRKSCTNIRLALISAGVDQTKTPLTFKVPGPTPNTTTDIDMCTVTETSRRDEVIYMIQGAVQGLRDKDTEMNRMGGRY